MSQSESLASKKGKKKISVRERERERERENENSGLLNALEVTLVLGEELQSWRENIATTVCHSLHLWDQ
jgi:hypothetical protein